MSKPSRRDLLLDRLADHLLDHGLANASLRPMAAAAGTSDRMLLYYFADREALLSAALGHVAARLAALLDAAVPHEPLPYTTLIGRLREALDAPGPRRYILLWLEVAARAGRGEAPYRMIGEAIGRMFLTWAKARLNVTEDADTRAQSALLLATLDGLALLDSVGLAEDADAAAASI